MAGPVWTWVHCFRSNFRTESMVYGMWTTSAVLFQFMDWVCSGTMYTQCEPCVGLCHRSRRQLCTTNHGLLSVQLTSCDTLNCCSRTLSDIGTLWIQQYIAVFCHKCCCDSEAFVNCSGVTKTWHCSSFSFCLVLLHCFTVLWHWLCILSDNLAENVQLGEHLICSRCYRYPITQSHL